MNCEECQKAESRFVDGELPSELSPGMFAHAATCLECRRFFDALVRLNSELLRIPPPRPTSDRMPAMPFPSSIGIGGQRIWHHRFSLGVPGFALTVVAIALIAVLSYSQFRKPAPIYVTELPTLIVSPDSTSATPGQQPH